MSATSIRVEYIFWCDKLLFK